MEQKFEALKKENPEQLKEYFEFVRSSVKDGSYFKDGLGWYFFRYVNPFCERTIFSIAGIAACIIFYCLIGMIQSAFPLVEKKAIVIRSLDQSEYFPSLVPLKPHEKGFGSKNYDPTILTVDEAVLKYLISQYVINREGYDFRDAEIESVNNKFNYIKNNSSDSQYREFQRYMSKDNPDSPLLNFGQNVIRKIEVTSVRFLRKESNDLADKARNFIAIQIPTDCEISFIATINSADDEGGNAKLEQQKYVAKINFSFPGIEKKKQKEADKKNLALGFLVKNYKLFKVQ